jgi:hypothetical protein
MHACTQACRRAEDKQLHLAMFVVIVLCMYDTDKT